MAGRSVYDRTKPTFQPITNRDALTVDELVRLFADRRCRFGSAVEFCTSHELSLLALAQIDYKRGTLNEGERIYGKP